MSKPSKFFISSLCSLVLGLAYTNSCNAQAAPLACNEITKDDGFTVRSVVIKGRWVPQKLKTQVEEIVGIGKIFSPENFGRAIGEIKDVLKQDESTLGSEGVGLVAVNQGAFSVLYIDVNTCDISDEANPKQVEIIFTPYYVRVDLVNVGDNVLPIPRFNTPSFSAGVPPALLATSPIVGVFNDRNYGPSLSLKTTTNLLDLPPKSQNGAQALNLNLQARQSFSEPFYNINTGLEYKRPTLSGQITPNVSVRYSNQYEPLGEGENWQEQLQIEGGIQQKPHQSFLRAYAVGGGVGFLDNSYTPRNSNSDQNNETGLKLYAVGDSRIGDGFARFGAWFDAGFPSETDSYQRLAVQGGYSKEISISKDTHNTMGLQIMAGSGYTWGNAPEYSQYFGGSLAYNFLYEPLNSARVKNFPSGPLLRSFGQQQAGLRGSDGLVSGGDFYWNLNFDITFPIPGWSRPLIPDVVVDESRNKTLADMIKGQVQGGQQVMIDDLVGNQGYSEAEAEAITDRLFKNEINPTINYLVDKANLFSVKPMLLVDVAQISGSDSLGSTVWAAVGGGIQVNVVNGRLEAGYMQTVAPAADTSVGNFFLRLVFQDFF